MTVRVGIVLGSRSDLPYADEAVAVLGELGIGRGAPRSCRPIARPTRSTTYIAEAPDRGVRVLIGMAGHAAALPGAIAARTTLPVIGVPLPTSDLDGQDALLAIVQMPPGIAVGTMAIGKPGARNAAWFAAAILALATTRPWPRRCAPVARRMSERVLADDAEVQAR